MNHAVSVMWRTVQCKLLDTGARMRITNQKGKPLACTPFIRLDLYCHFDFAWITTIVCILCSKYGRWLSTWLWLTAWLASWLLCNRWFCRRFGRSSCGFGCRVYSWSGYNIEINCHIIAPRVTRFASSVWTAFSWTTEHIVASSIETEFTVRLATIWKTRVPILVAAAVIRYVNYKWVMNSNQVVEIPICSLAHLPIMNIKHQ